MSWIVSLPCTRAEDEALSGDVAALDASPEAPVVVTREIDEDAGAWKLDACVEERRSAALLRRVQALVPSGRGREPAGVRPPAG